MAAAVDENNVVVSDAYLVVKDGLMYPVNAEILHWEFKVLMSLGRNYHYIRYLNEIETDDVALHNCVVQQISGMYINFFVDWCKIFGVDGNEVHWKKLFMKHNYKFPNLIKSDDKFQNAVRSCIYEEAKLSKRQFDKLFKRMTDFRNLYAAHIVPGEIPEMPFIDEPYQVANALTKFLAHIEGDEFRTLDSYRDEFRAEIATTYPK